VGNFFNQEALHSTDLPWKLYIDPYYRPAHLKTFEYFTHVPVRSLWNLLVFRISGSDSESAGGRPGALTLCYLGLYRWAGFFVEGLGSIA